MNRATSLAHARRTVDLVFAEHVGPIYRALSDAADSDLREKGHTGPGAIHRYITVLAAHITDPYRRATFKQQAFRAAFGARAIEPKARAVVHTALPMARG